MIKNCTYIVNTFIALQKYFKKHDLEKAVEFQNILSLHITLYYLDKELTDSEKEQLLADISSLSASDEFTLTELKTDYFGEPEKERVCYIGCAENDVLKNANEYFAEKYKFDQLPENQLSFVSHISLFRITDSKVFTPHRAYVDEIINANIESIVSKPSIKIATLIAVVTFLTPELFCDSIQSSVDSAIAISRLIGSPLVQKFLKTFLQTF